MFMFTEEIDKIMHILVFKKNMNIRIPFFYTYLNLFIYFFLFICFSNTMFDNFIKIYFHHFYYLQHRLKINPIICIYASSFPFPHIEQTLICFEQFIDQNLIIPWSNIKTWMYIIHTYSTYQKIKYNNNKL